MDEAFGVQSTLDNFTKQIAELENQMGVAAADVPTVGDTGGDTVVDYPLSTEGADKQKRAEEKICGCISATAG